MAAGRWLSGALLAVGLAPSMAQVQGCSPRHPEDFRAFFERFAADPQFAQRRTRLPLLAERWTLDDEDGLIEQPYVTEGRVSREAFSRWPSLQSHLSSLALSAHVTAQGESDATVEVGHRVEEPLEIYHFRLEAGCWTFWKLEAMDES